MNSNRATDEPRNGSVLKSSVRCVIGDIESLDQSCFPAYKIYIISHASDASRSRRAPADDTVHDDIPIPIPLTWQRDDDFALVMAAVLP